MILHHLIGRLYNKPLLVLPEYAQVMATGLHDRLGVAPMVSQDVVDRYARPAKDTVIDKRNGIAVVPVVGCTVHRGGDMEAFSGVQSYTAIQSKLTSLLDDRSVRGILLDIDSGGGEAAGIQELAAFVAQISNEKPVWAIANTCAASAAYWLAASAERLYAAPGANVGSVGVYVMHQDASKLLEKRGVVTTFIYAGKHKIDGNMFETLPDEVRATIQVGVDKLWDSFAGYVADRRGLTTETVQGFEARMFDADAAKENGLVDGVGTLGEVIQAFATYLNRPQYESQQIGATMSLKEGLLYGATDLAAARAEGLASATTANASALATAVSTALAGVQAEFAKSVTTLFPNSKRAEAFAEALTDGATLALSTKLAGKIEDVAPAAAAGTTTSRTQADVDAFMKGHAPDVSGGDEQNIATAKEKRLAEIAASGKSYSAGRGYTAL